jgi:hypothetical protein
VVGYFEENMDSETLIVTQTQKLSRVVCRHPKLTLLPLLIPHLSYRYVETHGVKAVLGVQQTDARQS